MANARMGRASGPLLRALRSVGFDLSRYRAPEARRQELLQLHQISTVLDVGANVGQYGGALRSAGYIGKIVSFEPAPEAFAQLGVASRGDAAWDCHETALGDAESALTLNITERLASSSLRPVSKSFAEHDPGARVARTVSVNVTTLDNLGLDLPRGHTYLKLDVQGFEDAVLRGAKRSLGAVALVECELSIRPTYDGQPALAAIVAQLDASGFALRFLSPGYRERETADIIEFDGIFERTSPASQT